MAAYAFSAIEPTPAPAQSLRVDSTELFDEHARHSAVERSFSWVKDPARVDMRDGQMRVLGLVKVSILRAIGYCVVNHVANQNFERLLQDPGKRRRKPRRHKFFAEALSHIRPAELPQPAAQSSDPSPDAASFSRVRELTLTNEETPIDASTSVTATSRSNDRGATGPKPQR